MEYLIQSFPKQLEEALEQTKKYTFEPIVTNPEQIVLCGMGGSGIAGHFVEEVVSYEIKIPFILHKGYQLPLFCTRKTLLILSSYSGNTEEVISIAQSALELKIPFVLISSGGELGQMAKEQGFPHFLIPEGLPPRSCIGYSIILLLYALSSHHVISDHWREQMESASLFLTNNQEEIKEQSALLAERILGKTVFAIGEDRAQSSLLRFKQQLNENAKVLCHYSLVPEMNHNELVGWREKNEDILPLIMMTGDEHPRNQERILFTTNHIRSIYQDVLTITAKGNTPLERRLYLIHLGDFISCDLARLQGYDPIEIDILVNLKKHMSDIPSNS